MSNIKIDWSEAPNWGNAPEWANWTAQNKDGNWNWFEAEPELYDYRFIPVDFTKHQFALRSENTDGWESSLQKKPNEVAIEFFDKLCDDTIDWSEAPEWANWSIQNPHGLWFWIENKPFINDSNEEYEIRQKGKFKFYKKTPESKDWTKTLQERPKAILSERRPRFESARVGDKAYSTKAGWGTIINIDLTSGTPLRFKPDSLKKLHHYDLYGHSNNNHKESLTPELYWDVPTITGGDIPPERMASIGGYEYPEPERFAPEKETVFYVPVNNGSFSVTAHHKWTGGENQQFLLESGGVHLKRENALQHSEARGLALKDLQGGDSFLINRKALDALKKSEGVDDDVSN